MSVRQRIKSTAIFKGLLAGFIFISAASFAAEKTEIKVGVIDSFNPEFSTQTLEPTQVFELEAACLPVCSCFAQFRQS